jgi:predicted nucleic acid-binding protein
MIRPEETVLLWQVAVEFLNCLRRWESKGKITSAEVEAHFHDVWTMFPLQLPTESYIDRSFDLRRRYMLSHWDSLLLAACQEAGVTRLYSEDLQNGANYDGVTVINPFV